MPAVVGDAPLGITMGAARYVHPALTLERGALAFRHEAVERFDDGAVSAIWAYFDADTPGEPLYEWIVEYRDVGVRDDWVEAHLGEPEPDGDWTVAAGLPWVVKSWRFDEKLVFAAAMPGTEYEEGF